MQARVQLVALSSRWGRHGNNDRRLVRIYINKPSYFKPCVGRYFADEPPARACYAVKDLPLAAKVEIECIALLK
jgi:enamine deaminase RidA (YjgF/YER057c/UK114 family)